MTGENDAIQMQYALVKSKRSGGRTLRARSKCAAAIRRQEIDDELRPVAPTLNQDEALSLN
jgi:hypothetical protein